MSHSEADEIRQRARCAICPETIGDRPFGIITDEEVIEKITSIHFRDTWEGPDGPFLFIHHRCYETAKDLVEHGYAGEQ